MSPRADVEDLVSRLRPYSAAIQQAFADIREELEHYSDGENFKGNELTGWLGEVFAKLFLGGMLVSDRYEHDVVARDMRVSVKARSGWRSGWTQSSTIPKIRGTDCPSHLMFVHLDDDFSPERMWLYPWEDLLAQNRFKPHVVRGAQRAFVFHVRPTADDNYLKYQKHSASDLPPTPVPEGSGADAEHPREPHPPPLTRDDVLVVPAAQHARNDYYRYSAYICQPNRAFKPVPRLAFDSDGQILRHIPKIKGMVEWVSLSDKGFQDIRRARLDTAMIVEAEKLLTEILHEGETWAGRRKECKFVLLSRPNDPETVVLHREITNDKRSSSGKNTAFTQGQRYVSFTKLEKHPVATSLLDVTPS